MPESLLYEGKAKKLYLTDNPDILRVCYKDDATAFNGRKSAKLEGKGLLNNAITSHFFEFLAKESIPSHFVRRISETEQLVFRLKIIPPRGCGQKRRCRFPEQTNWLGGRSETPKTDS